VPLKEQSSNRAIEQSNKRTGEQANNRTIEERITMNETKTSIAGVSSPHDREAREKGVSIFFFQQTIVNNISIPLGLTTNFIKFNFSI